MTMLNDSHREYLEALRDSGKTNMYAAGSWLQDQFGLSRDDARVILVQWMVEKQTGKEVKPASQLGKK
jgi:hypothetical protein